jgi:hypothetical protein
MRHGVPVLRQRYPKYQAMWWRPALIRHVFVPHMVPLRATDVWVARKPRRRSTKMSEIRALP